MLKIITLMNKVFLNLNNVKLPISESKTKILKLLEKEEVTFSLKILL